MPKSNRPRVVVGAFILNKKKEVLLVKSHKWRGLWYVPGGHIEEGESIQEALEREIREEVGLKVKVGQFLSIQEGIFDPHYYKRRHFIFLDYLCMVLGNEKVTPDGREVENFLWISPRKALKMDIDPYTRHSLEIYLGKTK